MDTNAINNLLNEAQQDIPALNKAFDNITIRMVIMTPIIAKTLITKHKQNNMSCNTCNTNYSVVTIDSKGYILDGYSHLKTIIHSNNEMPLIVITGITCDEE